MTTSSWSLMNINSDWSRAKMLTAFAVAACMTSFLLSSRTIVLFNFFLSFSGFWICHPPSAPLVKANGSATFKFPLPGITLEPYTLMSSMSRTLWPWITSASYNTSGFSFSSSSSSTSSASASAPAPALAPSKHRTKKENIPLFLQKCLRLAFRHQAPQPHAILEVQTLLTFLSINQ